MIRGYVKKKNFRLKSILTIIVMILLVMSQKSEIVKAEAYDGTLDSVLNVDGGTLDFLNLSGWTGATIGDRVLAQVTGYSSGYQANFTTSIVGPKVLSFDWNKTYSTKSSCTMSLYIDDIRTTELIETNSWVTQIVEIPSGVHTVRWNYYAYTVDSTNILYNTAYLDNVKIVQPLYTVTFNENHTSNSKITTATVFTSGDTVSLPIEPTRTGYIFLGWNIKADGSGTPFSSSTKVTANLTAYAQWGLTGSTTLPAVSSKIKVNAGKTSKIAVTNADGATITYKSANESIAAVDANGRVSGILGGSTIITTIITTSYGKVLEYKTNVTVTPTLKISKTSATIYVKKTLQLSITGTDDDIEWVSDDSSVATVSSKGVVTGKSKGTATIYAYVNGEEFGCNVVIKAYTNTAKAKNAYINFLEGSSSNKYFSNYFGLVDIDKDGTIELILGDNDPWNKDYYATWQIFTFSKGRVVYIGKIRGEGLGYSESKKTLLTCTSSNSEGTSENVYKKSKNKMSLVHYFYDGNYRTKKVDGKKHTKKYFNKIYNKYVSDETEQVVFYENNEQNRTEYLE